MFGRYGQVATEVQRRVPQDVTLEVIGRDRAEFTDPETVAHTARALSVDAVINAAAYTAVDKAEDERDAAELVNNTSVSVLGRECAARNIPLVHISTDYVFPGGGDTPWKPDDTTDPLGVYGATKLAGERGLIDSGVRHITLRTSWVFSAHGINFVKTMLRLGAARDELTIVADQIGGPTAAGDIADTCIHLAKTLVEGRPGGTYHYSGAPDVSWADFARAIFAQANLAVRVTDIPSSAYPTAAKRPMNSRLDCRSLDSDFGIARPDWKTGLTDVLRELAK